MNTAAVRHHHGVNRPMICFINKNEDKIRGNIQVSVPPHARLTWHHTQSYLRINRRRSSFFTKSSLSTSTMHYALFNYSDNLQPEIPTSVPQTPTQMLTCLLLIINLHITLFRVSLVPQPRFSVRS